MRTQYQAAINGKISLVAKKTLGLVPWSLKNALDRVNCDETDHERNIDSDNESDYDDGYKENNEPTTIEELRQTAIVLSEKRAKKTRISLREPEPSNGMTNVRISFIQSANEARSKIRANHMSRIQAKFGPTVVSFFKFLRATALVNLFNAIVIIGLIMVPQTAENNQKPTLVSNSCVPIRYGNVSYFEFRNASKCCSEEYQSRLVAFDFKPENFWDDLLLFLNGLFQGTKWMEGSWMFYGFYDGTRVFDFGTIQFDFPLGFLLVILSIMLANLIYIVYSSSKAFYDSFDGNFHAKEVPFSTIAFTKWDYGVSQDDGISILRTDILNNFRLADHKHQKKSKKVSTKIMTLRVVINIGVVLIIAAILFAIVSVTRLVPELQKSWECPLDASSRPECFFFQYLPSFTVTLINIVFPLMFTFIIAYESYSKSTELFLNLIRCLILRLASLVTALLSLMVSVYCDYGVGCYNHEGKISECENPNLADLVACENPSTNGTRTSLEGFCSKPICWETYVGQQFYMLTVVDFLAQVGIMALIDLPRSIFLGEKLANSEWKRVHYFLGCIEFGISKHVLDIVYSQTICWLAIFFAPLITIVTFIKFGLMYFLKILYILYVCVPSQVTFTASKASSLFWVFLLLSYGLSIACVGIFIGIISPSKSCGPFRDLLCIGDTKQCFTWDYITTHIEQLESVNFKQFLYLVSETSVQYVLTGILCLVAFFLWAQSNAYSRAGSKIRKENNALKGKRDHQISSLSVEIRKLYPLRQGSYVSRNVI